MISLLRTAVNTGGSESSLTAFPSAPKILTLRWVKALCLLLRRQTDHFHLLRLAGDSSSCWRSKGEKPVRWSRNRSPQECELCLDWSIVEEPSLRCDVCSVFSNL